MGLEFPLEYPFSDRWFWVWVFESDQRPPSRCSTHFNLGSRVSDGKRKAAGESGVGGEKGVISTPKHKSRFKKDNINVQLYI